MLDDRPVNYPTFSGPLAAHLTAFLSEKRNTGHKYGAESCYLNSIDRFSIQMNIAQGSLPKAFVDEWTRKNEYESHKTWQNRVVVMRQLARYLNAHEIPAHETSLIIHTRRSDFVPHIYTDSELKHIFEAADRCPIYVNCPKRRIVASQLFRLVYACGLRISEALNLKLKHVNLENGVLTIENSKFGTNRYVPMSAELTVQMRTYIARAYPMPTDGDVLFPAPDGGKYSKRAIAYMFHQLLHMAGISRTKNGPRIHDLRHTFSVNCLKKWVHKGQDLTTMLPVLSTYLGHKGLSGTQDYLRLTADMFPDICCAVETKFGDVIPRGDFALETE